MSADVVTLGEALVALVADEGRPLSAPGTFTPFVAGAEANVAMGLARLGRDVAFIGRVGADGLGQMVRNGLRAEGVDVQLAARRPRRADRRAGARPALASRRPRSSTCGAARLPRGSTPDDVNAAGDVDRRRALAAPDGHHARALADLPRRRRALRSSSRAPGGVRVSLDVNLRRRLWSEQEAAPVLRELAERCDLVIAGEDEAALLCGSSEASVLAERFGVEVVVKLGARGAVGCRDGELAEDRGHRGRAGRRRRRGRRVHGRLPRRAARRRRPGRLAAPRERLRRGRRRRPSAMPPGLPTRAELERVLAGGGDVVR